MSRYLHNFHVRTASLHRYQTCRAGDAPSTSPLTMVLLPYGALLGERHLLHEYDDNILIYFWWSLDPRHGIFETLLTKKKLSPTGSGICVRASFLIFTICLCGFTSLGGWIYGGGIPGYDGTGGSWGGEIFRRKMGDFSVALLIIARNCPYESIQIDFKTCPYLYCGD